MPTGAPIKDSGTQPLPATGPYEIASDTPTEVRLVRNPYFHEWSRAARPDGYPDQIVWRIGGSVEAAVTAVERGAADSRVRSIYSERRSHGRRDLCTVANVYATGACEIAGE